MDKGQKQLNTHGMFHGSIDDSGITGIVEGSGLLSGYYARIQKTPFVEGDFRQNWRMAGQ